jgi:hypothetical protein
MRLLDDRQHPADIADRRLARGSLQRLSLRDLSVGAAARHRGADGGPATAFAIRDAQWPRDRAAAVSFIDGLQRYEHGIEPDRRIGAAVGAEYFDVLLAAVAGHGGIVYIAEAGGRMSISPSSMSKRACAARASAGR